MNENPVDMNQPNRDLGFGTRVADMSTHRIDESSPFWEMTQEDCTSADVETLVLLTGVEETFSQTVHARSSYKLDEIVWNARFEDVFNYQPGQGPISIDVSRIHNVERLEPAP